MLNTGSERHTLLVVRGSWFVDREMNSIHGVICTDKYAWDDLQACSKQAAVQLWHVTTVYRASTAERPQRNKASISMDWLTTLPHLISFDNGHEPQERTGRRGISERISNITRFGIRMRCLLLPPNVVVVVAVAAWALPLLTHRLPSCRHIVRSYGYT